MTGLVSLGEFPGYRQDHLAVQGCVDSTSALSAWVVRQVAKGWTWQSPSAGLCRRPDTYLWMMLDSSVC